MKKTKCAVMSKAELKKEIYRHRVMYLFLIPAFVAVIVFAYDLCLLRIMTLSKVYLAADGWD